MGKETLPKVSFSLSPATSSRPDPSATQTPSQSFPHPGVVAAATTATATATFPSGEDSDDEAKCDAAKPELITVFDASQTLAAPEDARPAIIPPIPNTKMKKVLPVPESEEDYDTWKFREDVKELPEHRGLEEFKQVRVEDFPVAYLAGYGWSKGQVIGRNKMLQDPKAFEYTGRHGTQGLGYQKPKKGA
ncbi:protein MOS2-like [Canna indica]|uniref:Protein MOS2-like n=1 Tax=Canna indica TaxID=4628 RepID=A0AAQ3KBW2_9LILI|nr:protein MOS2-like [Canna indica]